MTRRETENEEDNPRASKPSPQKEKARGSVTAYDGGSDHDRAAAHHAARRMDSVLERVATSFVWPRDVGDALVSDT